MAERALKDTSISLNGGGCQLLVSIQIRQEVGYVWDRGIEFINLPLSAPSDPVFPLDSYTTRVDFLTGCDLAWDTCRETPLVA